MTTGASPPAVIDSHVHLWPVDRSAFPPMDFAAAPLPDFDATAETLVRTLDAHGIQRAVAVQVPWYAHDDRYLLDCARRFPDRIVPVGCLLEPWSEEAPGRLRQLVEGLGMRGVRLHLTDDRAVAAALDGAIDRLLQVAQALRTPLCLLYRTEAGHRAVEALARRFPDNTLVIDHMGHSVDPEALLALAEHEAVYVKLSLHYRLSDRGFPWPDLETLQRDLLDRFGARRLMWGSNFPMHMPDPDYGPRLDAVRDLAWLSPSDREWVLGGTAAHLWAGVAA